MRHPRPLEHIAHMLLDPNYQERMSTSTAEYAAHHQLEERLFEAMDASGLRYARTAPPDALRRLSTKLLETAGPAASAPQAGAGPRPNLPAESVRMGRPASVSVQDFHFKARGGENKEYPERQKVQDELVRWNDEFGPEAYQPQDWTHDDVLGHPGAVVVAVAAAGLDADHPRDVLPEVAVVLVLEALPDSSI